LLYEPDACNGESVEACLARRGGKTTATKRRLDQPRDLSSRALFRLAMAIATVPIRTADRT